jgi:hypothetical protein
MRKYLFNGSLLSAVAGGWSIFQTTKQGPRDWRLILMWISWGLTIAIAVGTITKQAQDSYDLEK